MERIEQMANKGEPGEKEEKREREKTAFRGVPF